MKYCFKRLEIAFVLIIMSGDIVYEKNVGAGASACTEQKKQLGSATSVTNTCTNNIARNQGYHARMNLRLSVVACA